MDLLMLNNRLLEFKINTDEHLVEIENKKSPSFYTYDFDNIKIQFFITITKNSELNKLISYKFNQNIIIM